MDPKLRDKFDKRLQKQASAESTDTIRSYLDSREPINVEETLTELRHKQQAKDNAAYVAEHVEPRMGEILDTTARKNGYGQLNLDLLGTSLSQAQKNRNAKSATQILQEPNVDSVAENENLPGSEKEREYDYALARQTPAVQNRYAGIGREPESLDEILSKYQRTNNAVQNAYQGEYQRRIDEQKQRLEALSNPAYRQTLEMQRRKSAEDTKQAEKDDFLTKFFALRSADASDEAIAAIHRGAAKVEQNAIDKQAEQEQIEQLYRESQLAPYYLMTYNDDFADKSKYNSANASVVTKYVNGQRVPDKAIPADIEGSIKYLFQEDEKLFSYVMPEERDIYNYILNTEGEDKAHEYLEVLTPDLQARRMNERRDSAYQTGYQYPLEADIATVIGNPLRLIGTAGAIYDKLANNQVNPNAKYNLIPAALTANRAGSVARTTDVSENIASSLLKKNKNSEDIAKDIGSVVGWLKQGTLSALDSAWAGFLGQNIVNGIAGMNVQDARSILSMAKHGVNVSESVVNAAKKTMSFAENLTRVMMGAGVVPDVIQNAKDRGYTDDQAFLSGMTAGLAEYISEAFSVGNLFETDWTKQGVMNYILNNLKQRTFEGLEEIESGAINWFADILIARNKSEWQEKIDKYSKDPNVGADKALLAAFLDTAKEIGSDALSAFLTTGNEIVIETAKQGIYNATSNKVHNNLAKLGKKNGVDYVAALDAALDKAMETSTNPDEESRAERAEALADLVSKMQQAYPNDTRKRVVDYAMERYRQSGDSIDRANIKYVIQDINNLGADIDRHIGETASPSETETVSESEPTAEETETESAPAAEESAEPAVSASEAAEARNTERTDVNASEASVSGESAESAYTSAFKNYGVAEGMSVEDIAKTLHRKIVKHDGLYAVRGAKAVTSKQLEIMQKLRASGQYSAEELKTVGDKMGEVEKAVAAIDRGDLQKMVNYGNSVLKKYGIKGVVIDDSMVTDYNDSDGFGAEKGSYVESDGTIKVSPLMTTNEMLNSILSHETVHYIVDNDKSEGKTVSKQFMDDMLAAKQKLLGAEQNAATKTGRANIENVPESNFVRAYAPDLVSVFAEVTDHHRTESDHDGDT